MGENIMARERNVSIDILKFMAVLFITNSHMNYVYGDYSALATGGAIGDVLFFFVSGFTLFMGRAGSFDAWYKRRIRRIYPSVFGWAIVALLFGLSCISIADILKGGGEFISAIMIYYVLLYFIRKYAMDRLPQVFAMSSAIVLLWYIFLFPEKSDVLMYKRLMRWPCFFLFMLMGAMTGRNSINEKTGSHAFRGGNNVISLFMLLICVLLFYGIQIVGKKNVYVSYLQITTLIPLFGIIYYLYQLANSKILMRLYANRIIQVLVLSVGGLCLEIYLVQMPMLIGGVLPFGFTRDALQPLFPLNVVILTAMIVPLAYITRATGRFFAQTFDSADGYDWKKVFRLM